MRGFKVFTENELLVFEVKVKKSIMPEELIFLRLQKNNFEINKRIEKLLSSSTKNAIFIYEHEETQAVVSDSQYQYILAKENLKIDDKLDGILLIDLSAINNRTELDAFLNLNSDVLKNKKFIIDPTIRYAQDFTAYCSQFIPVGQRILEIDLTNYCTHNCIYCGLYSDESNDLYRSEKGEQAHRELLDFKRKRLDIKLLNKLIHNLPYSVERVVLGGVGDPFLYPEIMDVIRKIRDKGIYVVVYSNMSYLTHEDIEVLHSYVKTENNELMIIANVSGVTAETYLAVRSNQNEEIFNKVMSNLEYIGHLRARDLAGIKIQLMAVVNTLNYQELALYALKAKAFNVFQVWFKPMEVYSPVEKKYEIDVEKQTDYFIRVAEAIEIIERYNIITNGLPVLLSQIELYKDQINDNDVKTNIKKLLEENKRYVQQANKMLKVPTADIVTDWNKILKKDSHVVHTKWRVSKQNLVREDNKIDGGIKEDFYDYYPCYMPDQYLRIFTDEKCKFCCVFPNFLNVDTVVPSDVIRSNDIDEYRSVLKNLPENREHQSSGLYTVCKQCPHVDFNVEYHERIMRIKLGLENEK